MVILAIILTPWLANCAKSFANADRVYAGALSAAEFWSREAAVNRSV